MMSDTEFDLKLKHIEEQYAARREGAEAYRDQELARLFGQCGWRQEKIATHMGKKQQWVSLRLIFGRFLDFTTTGCNQPDCLAGLTERRFRGYWVRTKGREQDRFRQVAETLANGIPQGHAALVNKPGIRQAVLACLGDGKTYTVNQITATVEESLPGVTATQVRNAMTELQRAGRVENRRPGEKVARYRLTKAKTSEKTGGPVAALYEECRPLIEELRHWGKQSRYEQAPSELLNIATRLERLFESRLAATKEHA
jgi:DNA-binding transcriptional ArsR family regulator